MFTIITARYYYCFILLLCFFILSEIMSSAEIFSTGVDWYGIQYSYGGPRNNFFLLYCNVKKNGALFKIQLNIIC